MRSSITGLTGFVWLPVLNHSLAVSIIWVRWFWPSSFSFARHQHDTLGSLFLETHNVAVRVQSTKQYLVRVFAQFIALAFMRTSFKFATPCWRDPRKGGNISPRLQPYFIGFCLVCVSQSQFLSRSISSAGVLFIIWLNHPTHSVVVLSH